MFTVDLRYFDTDLSKGDCNAFTGDHTATFNARRRSTRSTPAMPPTGAAPTFVARLSADLTLNTNVK